MNTRIKELARQAGIMFESTKQNRIHSVSTETLEKFAESIVRECADIAYSRCDTESGDDILKKFELE